MDFSIVSLKIEHIPAVAELEQTCFSQPWSEKSLADELARPDSAMFVAICDGKTVGWAGMEFICGEGSVTNIAVLPQFRRFGIGKALTLALIEHSKQLSLQSLTLEVRASNNAAISLYQSLGFELLGKRPNFYSFPREDALIMQIDFS